MTAAVPSIEEHRSTKSKVLISTFNCARGMQVVAVNFTQQGWRPLKPQVPGHNLGSLKGSSHCSHTSN